MDIILFEDFKLTLFTESNLIRISGVTLFFEYSPSLTSEIDLLRFLAACKK